MKKNSSCLIGFILWLFAFPVEAQMSNDLQKPTLITRSEQVIDVPSIASQILDGTFKPAENRVKEVNPKHWGRNTAVPGKGTPVGEDPLWQIQNAVNKSPAMAPSFTFEAASAYVTPTDPTGAVGPAHFVNSWNSSFRIWDKLGNPLTPEASLGTILPGTMGDPIVVYDRFADRFLITEFYSNGFDIAICKGPDPVNDGWWVYRFPTNTFPDYPKFSVWSDGYYITANKDQSSASTSQVVFAVERDKMILGNTSAQMVGFPLTGIVTSGFYSPLGFNANGSTMPPAGNSPIVYMQDDAWTGVTSDHLKIWSVNVNWVTPGSSTISSPQIINTQPFDGLFDGGSFSNLPQPSGSDIDALQATIMYMAQYRRFPAYNSVVFNFVVDLTNADNKAGIRWYELRQTTDGTPWTIYQEGTYSQPDGHSAFSGNMCMDASGNIALAYTTVSTTQYPSLRFTGRFAGDPLGTMTFTEGVIANGVQSDPASRYGDYSQMTIDPADDATFWSIGEYFAGGARKNHVGVFMIAPPALTAGFSGSPTTICSGGSVTFVNQSLATPTSWNWTFPGGIPSSYSGPVPPPIVYNTAGVYDVTLTVSDGTSIDTEVKTGYITVSEVIADFTGTPATVIVGNPVTFTDNSSCGPETWTWSFPGGTPSSYTGSTPPPVIYNTVGTYNVSLTVTKAGGTDTKTKTGYITVTLPIFNIAPGSITTCTGDFYDTGGPTGVYQDDEVITETFYPSTPGSMIRFAFTSFVTELGYDTLTIYNGINSSAPLIGKYHGSAGPGTVTASNASGALTFRFRSDVSVTYAGWAASISCYSSNIPPVAGFAASTIFPLVGQTVTFTDLSTNGANSWAWSFSPATVTYVGGTSASSQNPQVQFPAVGSYTVTLTATNAYGFDSEIKVNYINVTNCTISTLPFSESFSATTIPGCWSQVDHQGDGQVWQFGVITTQSPNPVLTGNYAYLDSDDYGSGNSQNADLISPSFNLSDYTGITLQFSHYFKSYSGSSGTVSYSLDNGTTWVQLQQFTTTSLTNPAAFSMVIPALAGQSQVKIKWNYIGAYAWYWGIDNVSVTGTCSTILPVSVSINASSNPVDAGTQVTFTASGVNGGTTPVYQWKVNNVNAGTNSNMYQYVPTDGDVIACLFTSSANCVTGNPAASNPLTMIVNSVPVVRDINDVTVSGTQCFDATQTIMVAGNNTTFSVVPGGSATLIAGENILFYPGTTVSEGGYLHGYIAPGGPFCIAPVKESVTADNTDTVLSAENTFFHIFPNPTNGDFTLTFHGTIPSGKTRVVIYSMKGERILSTDLPAGMSHEFSLSGRPAGIYLIQVIGEKNSGTTRLVKK